MVGDRLPDCEVADRATDTESDRGGDRLGDRAADPSSSERNHTGTTNRLT